VSRTLVADVVVDGMKRAGTPRLFGVATRADHALLEAARAHGLPVTLAASETGAGVMAAVTGDLVDAPGAVVYNEGAQLVGPPRVPDGAPFVLITSDHPSPMPGCKETLAVEPESAAHRIAHAVRLAMTEPRGAVHLDVPARVVASATVPVATSCRPDPLPYPDVDLLDRAAHALSGASRPLLLAGRHCRSADAAQWLRAFVEALPAPLLTTARAKGALPDPHPLMLGVLGIGDGEASLLARADLVVAIGVMPFEPVPESCWSARPIVCLGPTPPPEGRPPGLHVLGGVAPIIEELAARLRDKPRADWDVAELDRLRREAAARGAGHGLVARVVRLAREATPAGTIATVDTGAYYPPVTAGWHATAPGEFLAPTVPTTSGFALPAAIAARLANPNRHVVCFTSANGLAAAASELDTASRLGAPLTIVVFDGADADSPASARQTERSGITLSVVDTEARFAEAFARSVEISRPALIVVRS
jgi:acetolactate synthase I/II/III large subunit